MKKIIFLFNCCILTLTIQAQKSLDSLWGIWNDTEKHDTIRFFALNSMADKMRATNPDSALSISKVLYEAANASENQFWAGEAAQNIGLSYDNKSDYPTAIEWHQKALELFRAINAQANEAGSLNNIGKVYYQQGENDA